MTEQRFSAPQGLTVTGSAPGPGMVISETLLAPPDNGSKAARTVDLVRQAVDEAAVEVIDELDRLIKEIEEVKSAVIQNTALVKEQMDRHFKFGAEALGFRKAVRSRLEQVTRGIPEER